MRFSVDKKKWISAFATQEHTETHSRKKVPQKNDVRQEFPHVFPQAHPRARPLLQRGVARGGLQRQGRLSRERRERFAAGRPEPPPREGPRHASFRHLVRPVGLPLHGVPHQRPDPRKAHELVRWGFRRRNGVHRRRCCASSEEQGGERGVLERQVLHARRQLGPWRIEHGKYNLLSWLLFEP